jgi:hypothetical protein
MFNILIGLLLINSIFGSYKSNILGCGIVGFSGKDKDSKFNLDKIKLLLFWNFRDRGKDSTGVWSPVNGLKKSIKNAEEWLKTDDGKIEPDSLLISHVRQGTVGKTSVSNAHPFAEDWLILCHNGTLTNHHTVANNNDISNISWDIDSQVIAKVLAKDKTPAVFSEINGSFACLLTDKTLTKTNTLFVVRNSERQLYYGFLEEGMYISSIKESLEFIGCTDVQLFSTEKLVTIINGKIEAEKPLAFYKPPATVIHNNITQMSETQWLALDNRWGYVDTQDRFTSFESLLEPKKYAKYPKYSPIFLRKVVKFKDKQTGNYILKFFCIDKDGMVCQSNQFPLMYGTNCWEFTIGQKAIATTSLIKTKTKTSIADKGQEVEITSVDDSKDLVCFKSPKTLENISVQKKFLIPKTSICYISSADLDMLELPEDSVLKEADQLIAQYVAENSKDEVPITVPVIHKSDDKQQQLNPFGKFLYMELNLSLDTAEEIQNNYKKDENLVLISDLIGTVYDNLSFARDLKEADTFKRCVDIMTDDLTENFTKLMVRLGKVKIMNKKELVL